MTEPNNIDALIDHAGLAAAEAQHQAATARLTSVTADLAAARAIHTKATAASERAIAGLGGDAMTAETALEAATRALSVATRTHAEATSQHHAATAWLPTARGLAWKGVMVEGVRRRIAASRKADAARAALAEADAEHEAATAVIQQAFQNNVPLPGYSHHRPRILGTEASETALWRDTLIDAQSGVYRWDPGPAPIIAVNAKSAA